MHQSSLAKARLFVSLYAGGAPASADGRRRVLEVGSMSYSGQDTFRPLFPPDAYDYVGLDVAAGPHVDVVPASPFVWAEIADDAFDVCVSGQTFEHNPYFWVTFGEMARVLKPGGLAFVVAPGAGPVHRFPLDCWRFYPDGWAGLCLMAGMDMLESYFESDAAAAVAEGGGWRDSCLVARKPAGDCTAMNDRLRVLAEPYRDAPFPSEPPRGGPLADAYEAEAARAPASFGRRLKRAWRILRRGERLLSRAGGA